MSESPQSSDFEESSEDANLLDEIERRQDDVLRQLDELNARVELVLKAQMGPAAPDPGQALERDSHAA